MPKGTIREMLEPALNDPNTRELALAELKRFQDAAIAYRKRLPEFVAALERRGAKWPPGILMQELMSSKYKSAALEAILEVICQVKDPELQQGLVHASYYPNLPFDAKPIIDLFYSTDSTKVQREVCRTLPQTKAYGTLKWAKDVLSNPQYGNQWGDGRVDLCFFAGGFKETDGLADIIQSIFEEMPLSAPNPLGFLAQESHLAFLRDRLAHLADYPADIQVPLKRNLTQAINRAEKRLARDAVRKEKLAQKEAEKLRRKAEREAAKLKK